jgi:hypothetical protein
LLLGESQRRLKVREISLDYVAAAETANLAATSVAAAVGGSAARPYTVYPGIRKSRTSRYQNRPKVFSSSCFEQHSSNCAPLPVETSQTVSS